MRGLVLCVTLTSLSTPGFADTPTVSITGTVTDVHSRWTDDGSRIVTDATVHTDDGNAVVVSQLGGRVDGLAMRTFPGPEPLVSGMRVTVGARQAFDLSMRSHNVVDNVKVLAMPSGFVRTGPTTAGNYLFWESGCVFVSVDAAGTKEIAGDAEFPVVDAAIASWNTAAAGCSYLSIVNEGRRDSEVGRDYVNLIKFRDVSWCRPATKDDPARCHPDSAAGITTATYVDDENSPRDGAIVDADIELNGENFSISTGGMTTGTSSCLADLQNTLTHELGHLLGLEHSCRAAGDPERFDDKGQPVPLCGATTDAAIRGATMYNFQDCGETDKSTLEADDIAGVCGIYPTANDPGTCESVGGGGGCCSAGGSPTGSLVLSLLVGWTLIAPFWRRRG